MRPRRLYMCDSNNKRITCIKFRVLWIWKQRQYKNVRTVDICLHMYLADHRVALTSIYSTILWHINFSFTLIYLIGLTVVSLSVTLLGWSHPCNHTPRSCFHVSPTSPGVWCVWNSKFRVDRSPFDHNTGDFEFELYFKSTTILKECMSSTIPIYGFVDTEFSLIKTMLGNESYIMGMDSEQYLFPM